MNDMQARTWAEIRLDHLAHNYRALRAMLPRECRFLGVVKANAYGHGAVPVARRLEELGANYLAVAALSEAAELRAAGVQLPILILGHTPAAAAERLADLRLTQTVADLETARALSERLRAAGKTLNIHIKADTGMSRLGWLCGPEQLEQSAAGIQAACALPGLEPEGIFTHFADADSGTEDGEAYTMTQFTRFLDLTARLEQGGISFAIRHCANSAAVLHYPCTHLDMVRPGIALYGHYPAPCCEGLDGPGLLPVMALHTRVAAVRDVPAGTPVSYGRTHTLDRPARLAVLPAGYADGLPRICSDRLEVLINGVRAPVVGRICMDMCMADVTDIPGVRPGDTAEIFGDRLPIEEAADLAGTIQYELLCAVAPRVPRVYTG